MTNSRFHTIRHNSFKSSSNSLVFLFEVLTKYCLFFNSESPLFKFHKIHAVATTTTTSTTTTTNNNNTATTTSTSNYSNDGVPYPDLNTWNGHRMFITYIDRTWESRNTKNTYDFLVQVRNFLLPLSLKVFRHKEREIHLTFPSVPNHVRTRPRPWRARESHPSSSGVKTQVTDFSQFPPPKSSAHASGAWRHSHAQVWDFYFDISEWHILPARAWTPALMLHQTNPCTEPKGSQPN